MNLSPNRRAFLRGVGACLFLPTLESVGAPAPTAKGGVSGSATRLAYLYFPNGSAEGAWVPRETGPDGTLKQHFRQQFWTKNDFLFIKFKATKGG